MIRLQGTVATISGLPHTPMGARVMITRQDTPITWGHVMTVEHDVIQIALATQEGVVRAGDTVVYEHGDVPMFPVGTF